MKPEDWPALGDWLAVIGLACIIVLGYLCRLLF